MKLKNVKLDFCMIFSSEMTPDFDLISYLHVKALELIEK